MTSAIVGFVIAIIVGLTGIGAGSFTTPMLVLLIGLPAAPAVGTALVFGAILRSVAAPLYVLRSNFRAKYLLLLLAGGVPGILLGTWLLHFIELERWRAVGLLIVGLLLSFSSFISILPKFRSPELLSRRSHWIAWFALPIGVETGFSSAGAGALGTVLLLTLSEMTPAEVVGTDLLFGIVLALIGGSFHLAMGSVDRIVLWHLLVGGVPGILVGWLISTRFSGQKLRPTIAVIALVLGLQLVWVGGRSVLHQWNEPHIARVVLVQHR